jgi:hypothetical protein
MDENGKVGDERNGGSGDYGSSGGCGPSGAGSSAGRGHNFGNSPECAAEPVVCGWYTPDYQVFMQRLQGDLDRLNLSSFFRPVEKLGGCWEQNTLLKPMYMQEALTREGGATVLFVDVDCRFRGTREQILSICDIQSDIALRISGRVNSRGKLKMHPWSGTMVFRPTAKTFALLDEWIALKMDVHKLTTDEATLGVALTRVPGLTVQMLHPDACAGAGHPDPIILHPHRTGIRASKLMKILNGVLPW